MHAKRSPRTLTMEHLDARLLLAGDLQNACNPRDVTEDHFVTPRDALTLVNELNQHQPGSKYKEPARWQHHDRPLLETFGEDAVPKQRACSKQLADGSEAEQGDGEPDPHPQCIER